MQTDLSSNEPLLDIEIMGVNWAGLEAANSLATDGKSIPWLQDVNGDADDVSDAWGNWGAEHLDLFVLDAHNEPVGKTNLIGASLAEQENYSAVRNALVDAAMDNQKPWHNAENPLDIDGNGFVIPLDVLIIVDRLNSIGIEKLPPPGVQQSPRLFYDTNADGDSTPLDALLIVDFLNGKSGSASGEGESAPPAGAFPTEELSDLASSSDWRLSASQSQDPRWHEYAVGSFAPTAERLPMDSRNDEAKRDIVFREEEADWLEVPLSTEISEDGAVDGDTLREGSEIVLGMMR